MNPFKKIQKSWDENVNSPPDLNPFKGMTTENTLQPAWRRNKLPEFYDDGRTMKVGNYPIDMSDPRMIASIATLPFSAGALLPYTIGRQIDNIRQDRRLEKEYEPVAERNAAIAAQNANYGGTQGGSGTASSQQAFEEIMAQLVKAKRQVRQNQLAQEMQAIGALMSLFGYGAGTGKPGEPGSTNGATGDTGDYPNYNSNVG